MTAGACKGEKEASDIPRERSMKKVARKPHQPARKTFFILAPKVDFKLNGCVKEP